MSINFDVDNPVFYPGRNLEKTAGPAFCDGRNTVQEQSATGIRPVKIKVFTQLGRPAIAQEIGPHPNGFSGEVGIFIKMNMNFFLQVFVAVYAEGGIGRLTKDVSPDQAGSTYK